jgi:beta-glucosidase
MRSSIEERESAATSIAGVPMGELSRRGFAQYVGAIALGVNAPTALAATRMASAASPKPMRTATLAFPPDFRWGVATSAYQIEGAVHEDGRGLSIWDTYAHTPGKIAGGHHADVANDHYHRYREDVALMKELGAKAYRFSIAWPRIFPTGKGSPNAKGIGFYSRLVDELLRAGIEPFPTLYHWDLPQALQDEYGGWQSRETVNAFAEYSGFVARKLSDRVSRFVTLNAIRSFVDSGHQGFEAEAGGRKVPLAGAPGLRLPAAALNQVRLHAVLAQALSVQAIRAMGRKGTQCGPAENLNTAVPLIDAPEYVQAAEVATREINATYLTVMMEGKYPDTFLARAGKNAPKVTVEDERVLATPVDFVGINVYGPSIYVLPSDELPGYQSVPFNPSHPKMQSAWQGLGPEVMYWAPRLVYSLWKPSSIYITENGCAASDEVAADGAVYDSDRNMFTRNCLTHLQRATAEGAPVKGYFHWSLMDDFQWSAGYDNRFGLVYVDFKTQKRTPKLSAAYFRETAWRNAVV